MVDVDLVHVVVVVHVLANLVNVNVEILSKKIKINK
jgi:hypothetical protein